MRFFSECLERVEIAGSIRRQKPEVKDIELVAIPKPLINIFGEAVFEEPLPITSRLHGLSQSGQINLIKNGLRYKQFELLEYPDRPRVDLFLVIPPAQWGAIFTIRTGSADFSRWLMTPRRKGGCMPDNMRQRDGALWDGEQMLETPTEESYFEALGIPWVPPEQRNQVPERGSAY